MRLPLRRGRTRRPPASLGSAAILALASLAPSTSEALNFNPAPSANLDFSQLGNIAIAGDYNGISLYEYEGQLSKQLPTNGSEALLARLPNGALAPIVTTDAAIRAMCVLKSSSGELRGVILGGNFTSLDSTESTAIALFNPNTTDVKPLTGLEGEVNALLCDNDRDTVYVGGNFKGSNSTNAIAWSNSDGWFNLPFAGFNGPVNAITKAPNGHIIFGGSFTGLGNNTQPSQPDGQIVNLSTANITATNGATSDGFRDPKAITCSTGQDGAGNTWLAADKSPATWQANFGFGFEPTKLRIWNTHLDGRGTKTFRFLAFPINGIMNFTYVDPTTQKNATCTSECPLSSDTSIKYQDFHFVNRVGMNSFQIAISDWYGNGAGLNGVELFQDNVFAYAIESFNEPTCKGIDVPSAATATGPWKHSPSVQSSSDYLTAKLSGDVTGDSASVVFFPNIRESGNYSVNMYTPGCMPDQTCSTRGIVNVTGTMSPGDSNNGFQTDLFQTNYFDKYDQIYFGYMEKSSDSFKPSVTIRPSPNQNVNPLTVVAMRVGFTLIKSTGGLNGLYDFDPTKEGVDSASFEDSPVNKLGFGFSKNSAVKSLATSGDKIYIGGNFTSKDHSNAVAIGGNNGVVTSLDGGLNGQVLDMYLDGTKLYVGGEFNATLSGDKQELNHAAVYDTGTNTWSPLGAGVNGMVSNVVPMRINHTNNSTETVIALTGSFSECNPFNDSDAVLVDGFAMWIPSKNNWLQNIDEQLPTYSGVLSASVQDVPNDGDLLAGALSSSQLAANGVASLTAKGLAPFPAKIEPADTTSSGLSRRDTISGETPRGVVTGTFYDGNDKNITILAGHFSAKSTNGSAVHNLMFVDGQNNASITGIGSGVSSDSIFTTLALRGSTLYAGGKVSGTVDGSPIGGLVSYDVESKSFVTQPAAITGKNGTVSAITVRPGSSEVYVGGSFDKAGALDCAGFCLYNAGTEQWIQPARGMSGEVMALMWSSTTVLMVAGDLATNETDRKYLLAYDTKNPSWSSVPGADAIPGPVEVITPASSDKKQAWIAGKSAKDGTVYLMKYDGKKWLSANQTLPGTSTLRSLQVFTLTKDHDKTDMLDQNQVLMLTGAIDIPDAGKASAAIYNGTHFQPYALTTNSGNSPGTIARIFTQKDDFFSSNAHHMPLVFVVLIGLAISLALILLLVLGGIILERLRKKREGYTPAPTSMYDRGSGIQRIPPHELLESLGRSRPGEAPHV